MADGRPTDDSRPEPCANPDSASLQNKVMLTRSKQQYERMANTLPVMLYDSMLDADGTSRFLYLAPQPCREILELDPEALLADMGLVWQIIHPDDLERFHQEDLASNREGRVFTSEVRIVTHSGRLKWLLVNSRPNPAEPGEPIVWSGYLQDITERKQAEEARLELEHKLELAKKSESLTRMAGAIAHNFNNQLQAVIGNLELVLHKLPAGTESARNLGDAMQAARRAGEMTRLMLAYIGQTPVNHELIDLTGLLRQYLPDLQEDLPNNVTLVTELSSVGPAVNTDAHQIKQLLHNLVINARESLGENQGTIYLAVKTVSSEEIPTKHRFPLDWQPRDQQYVCLAVKDTGSGIAQKDIEHLFDPFFSTKFTGRGLGLSVVLGIVRAHLGAITVQSETDRSTLFQIFLPVAAAVAPRPAEEAEPRPAVERRGTVLLIEDERMVREIARAMLEKLGFMVLEAVDGAEAMQIFQQHRDIIELVLSDLTMPGMSGWEVLAAVRRQAPDLPVILASGYDQAQILADAHLEHPQAFLNKPYRLAELEETIRQALKKNTNTNYG